MMELFAQPTFAGFRCQMLVRLIPSALLAVLALGPTTANRADAARSTPVVNVEVVTPATERPLLPGERLTVKVRLDVKGNGPVEDLVAIMSSPYLPTRLQPFEHDPATQETVTELDIQTPAAEDFPAHRRFLPLMFSVAQRKNGRLVTLAKHTLTLTVDLDSSNGQAPTARQSESGTEPTLTDAPPADPVGIVELPAQAIALEPPRIDEHSLLPEASAKPSPAYWQRVKGRIADRMRAHRRSDLDTRLLTTPTVHFRLFANGRAESIRLDPGSGDSTFDQTLLDSVADAQPFPPFPENVTDPHLDVHLTIPAIPARPGAPSLPQ